MGTRGFRIFRYRGRYYVFYNHYDSYPEGLGAQLVNSIPTDPDEYKVWLHDTRAHYAARQHALDHNVHQLRPASKPDYSLFSDLYFLPSELQQLDLSGIEYIYIINLDHEVFTINFSVHFPLQNIPRKNNLWMRAMTESIYPDVLTLSLQLCPQQHMASPAIELRRQDPEIGFKHKTVTPKTRITDAPKMFLTLTLANLVADYEDTIIRFAREWEPDSFPFRELVFALISIASGQASFHSLPPQPCDPRDCGLFNCNRSHMPKSSGWVDQPWVEADSAPCLEFGFMSHHDGQPPGISPAATMYWHQTVLVSLTLVVDGRAMTDAVAFGIHHRKTPFQVVVLSLFEVAFADVFFNHADDEPRIQTSSPLPLSPLRPEDCLSTHPRERPELKPGMARYFTSLPSTAMENEKNLTSVFPGLAALVHFLDAAAGRPTAYKSIHVPSIPPSLSADYPSPLAEASKSLPPLPTELQDRILDFIDYNTWKACLQVSPKFRRYCLGKFMIDNRMKIVAGPSFELQGPSNYKNSISFDMEDATTGKVSRMIRNYGYGYRNYGMKISEYNWMSMVGDERKALILDSIVQFGVVV